jgi:3'-phosphoadenosine 5'-phosphosulfate sulfotransferase (PAPS reductase)/FAD synthetase
MLEEKKRLLEMTLDEKIQRTKELILEWYLQYDGKVYVSFSGGKDSTVLLHITRSMRTCKDIVGVFSDTGLEYPEIRDFVKKQDNITWIRPKLTFKEVLEKYGWPVVSKEQSHFLYDLRTSKSEKLKNYRLNGGGRSGTSGKLSLKWRPLISADFKISDKCCDVMKKRVFKTYEKETGFKPILGVMAGESRLRLQQFIGGNCNAFSDKHPKSRPMLFWTEQDVLEYIKRFNLEIATVYGEIKEENGKLKTTGVERTGCMFCMYGLHLESTPNRFDKMKETHPKQYDYIMNKLNGKHVLGEYLKCSSR